MPLLTVADAVVLVESPPGPLTVTPTEEEAEEKKEFFYFVDDRTHIIPYV